MKQQKVVGYKTEHVYFKGTPAECRRFINDNSIVKQHNKKLSVRYELKEPLWVTWWKPWTKSRLI